VTSSIRRFVVSRIPSSPELAPNSDDSIAYTYLLVVLTTRCARGE
jgi:hypothetical protein